jgi:uncharacterized protein (TIGR02391 family)
MAQPLTRILPDVETLLALRAEELAKVVLSVARDVCQHGMVHLSHLYTQARGDRSMGVPSYPEHRLGEVDKAISAAWAWLQREGLLIPAPGTNGTHGWVTLSSEAERISTDEDFEHFRAAAAFPRFLLHPRIADDVYGELLRGQFDTAVFKSMRAIEEAVREASGLSRRDLGPDLMRKAFATASGPLSDPSELPNEQESLAHLYAGAIGYFKNPQSHRTVNVEPDAARQLTLFASLLLRMIDERPRRSVA